MIAFSRALFQPLRDVNSKRTISTPDVCRGARLVKLVILRSALFADRRTYAFAGSVNTVAKYIGPFVESPSLRVILHPQDDNPASRIILRMVDGQKTKILYSKTE